jgi:hypothetical protein
VKPQPTVKTPPSTVQRVFVGLLVVSAALLLIWVKMTDDTDSEQKPGQFQEGFLERAGDELPPETAIDAGPGLKVPIFIEGGAAIITLKVSALPEARILVRVTNEKAQRRPDELRWPNLVKACAFVALNLSESATSGLIIDLDSDGLDAHLEQMAALTKAIQLGIAGRAYPVGKLAIGVVAPNGSVYSELRLSTRKERATSYGFELWQAPGYSLTKRKYSATQPLESGVENDLALREAMVSALGAITAKKAYALPLPAATESLIERVQTLLVSHPVRSVKALVQHAQHSAILFEAIRILRFSSVRIATFVKRMVDNGENPDGWRIGWLTQLIQTRINNEQRLRKTLIKAAVVVKEAGDGFSLPSQWLNVERNRLSEAGKSFRALLRSTEINRARQPRPFPFCDSRLLTWPARGLENSASAIVDWGQRLHHVALIWSHLVTKHVLRPQRILESTEPEGVTVKWPDTLERMLDQLESDGSSKTSDRKKIERLLAGWESMMWQRQTDQLQRHLKKGSE